MRCRKGYKTTLAAALTAIVLMPSIGLAGDIAAFQPLGFSADGKVFAFEEYGVQDGSGFLYANIFAIDTLKDVYVAGTPLRVRLDDEAAGIGQAREQARQKADAKLGVYRLEDQPGQLVAFNPVTEGNSNPHELTYHTALSDPLFGTSYGLRLQETQVAATADCKDYAGKVTSFRLVLTSKDSQPVNKTLYEDTSVPKSRNCPSGYRLGGVVTYTPAMGGQTTHIAMIMVFGLGFEGRDGRWIAVPVRP